MIVLTPAARRARIASSDYHHDPMAADDPLDRRALDLEAIKARLVEAGYPHPGARPPTPPIREPGREAQAARAELREHIIDDIWALLDEVAALRASRKP